MSTEFSTIFAGENQRLDATMFEGPRAGSRITNRWTRVADLIGIKRKADWRRPGQLGRLTMLRYLSQLLTIIAIFNIVGCSSDKRPPLQGWQAIHANAGGDGWRGPIRSNNASALADADAYARKHGVDPDEIIVLAVYQGMDTTGQLPPNPLARRHLDHPVTLDAITGYWEIVDRGEHANEAKYLLDVRADGKCKTDYATRFTDEPFNGFDMVEVLTDSSFVLAITHGEDYVFAVTRFDGHEMDVLLGGWKQCPLTLTRKPRPPREQSAESVDE